jgi:hypothetical protein
MAETKPDQATGPFLSKSNVLALVVVTALALVVRILQFYNYHQYFELVYGGDVFVDRIGESYHRWVMDVATIRNVGVYSDYASPPNQTAIWPPLYNYLSIILMLLLGDQSILPPRLLSLIAGVATIPMVYVVCRQTYGGYWKPFIGCAVVATLPWHVDFSVLGVPHTLIGLLLTIAILFFTRNEVRRFAVFAGLSLLAGYEAWFVVILLLWYARSFRGWKDPKFRTGTYLPLVVMVGWTLYTIVVSGNPLGWFGQYLLTLGWSPSFNLAAAGFYVVETLRVTFFIFFLGLAFGLYHSDKSRITALAMGAFVLAASFARVIALDAGDVVRLVPIYPLMAIAFAAAFPRLKKGTIRRMILVATLIFLMIVPHVAQAEIETGPKKAFIQMPEYRAGLALKASYTDGRILADGPTAIYYSGIAPSMFVSFKDLEWYARNPDDAKLVDWLKDRDIRWMLWENASFSDAQRILPSLASGNEHIVGDVRIVPVYEDTLERRREIEKQGGEEQWEHLPEFGGTTPEVIVYRVDLGAGLGTPSSADWFESSTQEAPSSTAWIAKEFEVV